MWMLIYMYSAVRSTTMSNGNQHLCTCTLPGDHTHLPHAKENWKKGLPSIDLSHIRAKEFHYHIIVQMSHH